MSTPTIVETYSSFAYAVEPRAFIHDDRGHAVQRVDRIWKTPGHTHFYVRDEYDELFELIYDQQHDHWRVRAFGETCPSSTYS